jgi:hypothetical protein
MSIINEALKKAARQDQEPLLSLRSETFGKNLGIQAGQRKPHINWGPVFVVSVLVLIGGPILAPVLSPPFRHAMVQSIAWQPVVQTSPSLRGPSLGTRNPQFGIEEGGPAIRTPADQPDLNLSGVVISPEGSYCILNERVVKQGDTVQGAKLVAIHPDEVTLDYHGERIVLTV